MATDFCSSGELVRSAPVVFVLANESEAGTSNNDVSSTPTIFLSNLFLVFFISVLSIKRRARTISGWRRAGCLSFDCLNGNSIENLRRSCASKNSRASEKVLRRTDNPSRVDVKYVCSNARRQDSPSVRRAMFVATHASTIHSPSGVHIGSNCDTEGINVLN